MLSKPSLQKLQQQKFLAVVLFSVAVIAGLLKYLSGPGHYNNYLIFKNAFLHLEAGLDLYTLYPAEGTDYFLYSPAFALLMAPFAALPDWLGIVMWCCLNSFAVFMVLRLFPFLDNRKRLLVLLLLFFELVTSQQNMQTNPIVASLIILAFVFFERKNVFLAALFIMLCFYIKLYGIVAASLFLLYPGKPRFILSCLFWAVLLFLLPLFVVSLDQLLFLYRSWFGLTASFQQNASSNMTSSVQSGEIAISVMSWLRIWFGLNLPALYVQLAGGLLFMLPFARIKMYKEPQFRIFLLASVLIWCVIFNHIAESASYMVAMFGVALWYVSEEKNPWVNGLMILALLLTSLSATDLFPKFVRIHYIKPYVLKGFPCMLIWGYVQARLMGLRMRSGAGLRAS